MKILTQIYVGFLFCLFFHFSFSNDAFCYAREGHILSRAISSFEGMKHENYVINQSNVKENSANPVIFNVLDNGAKGDGITNDAKAFEKTWDAACKTRGGVMLIPSGFTFLLQPVNFDGSYCQPNVVVQVDGKIVAPSDKRSWVASDAVMQWILFQGLSKGITIKGNGVIDGRGGSWWDSVDDPKVLRPHAVGIISSSDVMVTGITIQNSPRMHIFINDGKNITIYNFTVTSPGDSPNTDGIHLSRVQHVVIHDTTLACGDDCVSIQSGTSDVKIYDVNCGPGHGFSIGGLGPKKQEAQVSDISIFDSTAHDTSTGVRIKTWPGGYGSAHNVIFENITMSNVKIPIVIDQYYSCKDPKNCRVPNKNAVAIYDVTYKHIKGTYSYKPISLACSKFVPCRNLTLDDIEITPTLEKEKDGGVQPYCLSAYGQVLTDTTPPLKGCVLSKEALPSATPVDIGHAA